MNIDNFSKREISYKATNFDYYSNLEEISCDFDNLLKPENFKRIGFQGKNFYEASTLLRYCIVNNYKIILAFPSNLISSGLRDLITTLCKKKAIHVIITTSGGIEEDMIKCYYPFKLLKNKISDVELFNKGVSRTQNLIVPNEGYVWLENHLKRFFTNRNLNTTPVNLIRDLSDTLKPTSYLKVAKDNEILVLPLGLEDGAIGDHFSLAYYKATMTNSIPITINCAETLKVYIDYLFKHENDKFCVLALGGNMPKHFAVNGLISRGGADALIYINNEPTLLGSNEGASCEEAISWGKLKIGAPSIKVQGDFIFLFPLLIESIKDLL